MQYGSLLGYVARFAQSMAERPVQVQKTWRASCDSDFFYESQPYGCHTSGFYLSGEQSHGPRADGSSWYQQSQVHTRLADAPRSFLDRRHETFGTRHQSKTEVLLGEAPDDMLALQFAQALDRKH